MWSLCGHHVCVDRRTDGPRCPAAEKHGLARVVVIGGSVGGELSLGTRRGSALRVWLFHLLPWKTRCCSRSKTLVKDGEDVFIGKTARRGREQAHDPRFFCSASESNEKCLFVRSLFWYQTCVPFFYDRKRTRSHKVKRMSDSGRFLRGDAILCFFWSRSIITMDSRS